MKISNYYLYNACLSKMVDLFFSFKGNNYARYLCYFSIFLNNIEETYLGATKLLKLVATSMAISFIPAYMCAVDKIIKETYATCQISSSPGRAGCWHLGLLNNDEAYYSWARTAHEISR